MRLRHAPRYKRRMPVRFWEPETGEPHQAFTIDISLSGMFIATRAPLATGSRFRIELLEPGHNYIFQGEVMRSAKVAPELQRLGPSGMGVRLLEIAELVRELIPKSADRPRIVTPPQRTRTPPRVASTLTSAAAGRLSESTETPHAGDPAEPATRAQVYLLRFASPEVFLQIYRNYHEAGGFLVPTRKPGAVGDRVRVTLELLRGDVEPLQIEGRVASHEHEGSEPDEPPTGMRVTFLDPDAALEQLRAIIRRLRGGG